MLWRNGLQAGGVALVGMVLVALPARAGDGDWPMDRHDLLRSNHPTVQGDLRDAPRVAWRARIGSPTGSQITADFDRDGVPEFYAAENWCVVRKDAGGQRIWQSSPISRSFSVVAFEDLDGDGDPEPLLLGSGLNDARPLYFVIDPRTGRIRWRAELPATNGGDFRLGKIDPARRGLQLLRSLMPDGGQGELHLFCWDKGVEQGYTLWSWTRAEDFIYFPQLCVGAPRSDGPARGFLLSQMCVWMFDLQNGNELGRVRWGRSRSYGGHFGLWAMRPELPRSLVIASAFDRITVVDIDRNELAVRWDHPFEPGVEDSSLRGQLQFLPDGVCDLDGDGWSEIVVNQCAADSGEWRVVGLAARDGAVLFEWPGRVLVGAADLDGDRGAELLVRERRSRHDLVTGPVIVVRPTASGAMTVLWTASRETTLVREPESSERRLDRHPDAGDRPVLVPGRRRGTQAFFLRELSGQVSAVEREETGFDVTDRPLPQLTTPVTYSPALPGKPLGIPLAADLDGDGTNEILSPEDHQAYVILQGPNATRDQPAVAGRLTDVVRPPLCVDLDGDGRLEVVAIRRRAAELQGTVTVQQSVEVLTGDLQSRWHRTWEPERAGRFTLGEGGLAVMSVTAGNFRRQDRRDVALCLSGEKTGGQTVVLDGETGRPVWQLQKLYPEMYGECWDFYPPVVFDYDGDGLDDLATVCQTVHYTVLQGRTGTQLVKPARDVSSQGFGQQPPLFPGQWAVAARLSGIRQRQADLRLAVVASQAAVGVLQSTGDRDWSLGLPVVQQLPSPGCWVDLDGDGQFEMAFLHRDGWLRTYDGDTGRLRWEENLSALGHLLAADVDGDGADELIVSTETGLLSCYEDRPLLVGRPHLAWSRTFEALPGPPIFADVDGDGRGELLLCVADGFVYCLK